MRGVTAALIGRREQDDEFRVVGGVSELRKNTLVVDHQCRGSRMEEHDLQALAGIVRVQTDDDGARRKRGEMSDFPLQTIRSNDGHAIARR